MSLSYFVWPCTWRIPAYFWATRYILIFSVPKWRALHTDRVRTKWHQQQQRRKQGAVDDWQDWQLDHPLRRRPHTYLRSSQLKVPVWSCWCHGADACRNTKIRLSFYLNSGKVFSLQSLRLTNTWSARDWYSASSSWKGGCVNIHNARIIPIRFLNVENLNCRYV